jgi:hypothetical protein
MITLIYGAKGTGKTKKLIDAANTAAQSARGDIVYLTDNPKHSVEIKHTVRFVDAAAYGIKNPAAALGFIKGILSVNNDILQVYIDGLARIADTPIDEAEAFYRSLEALSDSDQVDFFVTVSADIKAIPKFMKKYI